MLDISRALKIEGWMQLPELDWLATQAQTHRIIVELGSYMGRSTRALGDHTPGVVFALDDWFGPREIEIDSAKRALLETAFRTNLADLLGRKVIPVNTDHRSYNPYNSPAPDMVFIDGGHEYENVKRDISFWLARLQDGGLLCGHDYGWGAGVNQAVDELLPARQIAPNTSIWYVTK